MVQGSPGRKWGIEIERKEASGVISKPAIFVGSGAQEVGCLSTNFYSSVVEATLGGI